ncbi:glycoprotein [Shayang Fly Virus 1]|uniref:Glycoprotein n=1 Tax=Shayang Fly Virus 1 TaxID=1608065 RepID=A0A0B5KT86_9VIRU|nr:glycoprotein [Shayang Fly Virus 1]AJG39052.1 glycoprotein [Shayang Fly Virus 1]
MKCFFAIWTILMVVVSAGHRPKLHKTLGVVVNPAAPIYPTESDWVHMIKIQIPCLQDVLSAADSESLPDMLSILKSYRHAGPKAGNVTHEKVRWSTVMMSYRYISAKARVTVKELKALQHKTQHGWGIFPSTSCGNPYFQFDEPERVDDDGYPIVERSRRSTDTGSSHTHNYNMPGVQKVQIEHHHHYHPDKFGSSQHIHQIPAKDINPTFQRDSSASAILPKPYYYKTETTTSTTTLRPIPNPTQDEDEEDDYDRDVNVQLDQEATSTSWLSHCIIPYLDNTGRQKVSVCLRNDELNPLTGGFESCRSYQVSNILGTHQRDQSHKRVGRSLCDWCGSAFSWLYGLTTKSEMIEMTKAIQNDYSIVVKKVNEGLSQQKVYVQSIKDTLDSLSDVLQLLSNQSTAMKAFSTLLKNDIDMLSDQVKFNAYLDQFSDSLSLMDSYLDNLITCSHRLTEWYRSLKYSLQSQTIDLDLLPQFSLSALLDGVSGMMNERWMIPDTWKSLKFLQNNMVSVAVMDHSLLLAIQIPMILKSKDLSHWTLSAVPHVLDQDAGRTTPPFLSSQILIDNPYVIIDGTNKRWTSASTEGVLRCQDRSDHMCSGPFVWKSLSESDCIPSLILNVDAAKAGLNCQVTLVKSPTDMILAQVDANHWLISILSTKVTVYQACHETKDQTDTTTETEISGLNLVQVPENCAIQVRDVKIQGYTSHHSETMIVLDLNSENSSSSVLSTAALVVFKEIKSALRVPLFDHHITVPSEVLNNSLFENGKVRLGELRRKLNHLDEIQLLDSSKSDITMFLNKIQTPSDNWSILPWWAWGMIVVGGFIVVLFTVKVIIRRLASPAAVMGPVLFSQPSRSFAVSISVNSTNATVLNMTIPQLINHHTSGWLPVYQCVLATLMACIMLICIYKVHCQMFPLMQRWMMANQVFPKILNMSHHPGEVPITLTILCQINHLFSSQQTGEIGLQIGTLPLPSTQWYVDDSEILQHGVIRHKCFRIYLFKVPLDWSKMCIKSTTHHIETCQAMPPLVKLPWSDVICQLESQIKWDWTSVEPICVTTIAVGQSHSRRVMKTYLDSTYHA